MSKPKLCVDFDGVCHLYSRGWQDGSIYDGPTAGLFEWILQTQLHFEVIIYSSRSKTAEGIAAMKTWFASHYIDWCVLNPDLQACPLELSFADVKPAAFLTIDDRAVCFDGCWERLTPELLLAFKPWNARESNA